MLSSVTINCQVTKIVINPGSQLSDIVISVANVTSPYDYSIREHLKCQIITADQMSVNKDCHQFRFSIVSIVSVSNVTSTNDRSFRVLDGGSSR